MIRATAVAAVNCAIDDNAVDLLLAISPRKTRQAIELAYPIMVCTGRTTIAADDMRYALEFVEGGIRRRAIEFTR